MAFGIDTSLPAVAAELLAHRRRERVTRLREVASRHVAFRRRRAGTPMRQLTATRSGIVWKEVPAPEIDRPTGALVRPLAVATCDADHLLARGEGFPLPLALGHETVAKVLEVGPDVSAFRPGDIVIVPFQVSCGACGACRDHRSANCAGVPPLAMYGFGALGGAWGGALCEVMHVPFADHMLVRLPAGVDPIAVASVADNVVDAWRHVAPALDQRPRAPVLVLGDGARSIGLYAVQAALALGSERVQFMARDRRLLEHAERLGAHPIQTPRYRTRIHAPLVVDASGSRAGLARALRHTARDGRCSSAYPPARQGTMRIPLFRMYLRGTSLHIGRAHVRDGMPAVLELIQQGKLDPGQVTTAHADWEEADQAFRDHIAHGGTKLVVSRREIRA